MNYSGHRDAIKKMDMVLADLTEGGLMRPAQAKKFLVMIARESTLIKQATFRPMDAQRETIDKIGLNGMVLRPASEGQSLAPEQRTKLRTSSVELNTKEFRAEIRISDRFLRGNIESQLIQSTIMKMLSAAVAADMDNIIINGDRKSDAPEPALRELDGILVQAKSHVADAAGQPLSFDLLNDTLLALPEEHRKNPRDLRFYTSVNAEQRFRGVLSKRPSALGDRILVSDDALTYGGVPIETLPYFPSSLGEKNDQTQVILVNPKNIHVGVWQNIQIETQRDVSARSTLIVASVDFDVKYAVEDAVAKCINVGVFNTSALQ